MDCSGELRIDLPQSTINGIVDSIRRAVPDVEEIYVFGSYARREDGPDSDIDLYVVTPSAGCWRGEAEAGVDAMLELRWLRKSKDVIVSTPERFRERAGYSHTLEANVAREGILIYGRPK